VKLLNLQTSLCVVQTVMSDGVQVGCTADLAGFADLAEFTIEYLSSSGRQTVNVDLELSIKMHSNAGIVVISAYFSHIFFIDKSSMCWSGWDQGTSPLNTLVM